MYWNIFLFVIADVLFKRLTNIDDLALKGNVNRNNPKDSLDQIVYLDGNEDIILKHSVKFHNNVSRIFVPEKDLLLTIIADITY